MSELESRNSAGLMSFLQWKIDKNIDISYNLVKQKIRCYSFQTIYKWNLIYVDL